jgi:hypothetical protein
MGHATQGNAVVVDFHGGELLELSLQLGTGKGA